MSLDGCDAVIELRTSRKTELKQRASMPGCTMTIVRDSHQQRRLRVAVFLVATVSLLLLLLAAHAADHHGIALACFTLLPVFLFGTVVVQDCLWRILPANDRLRGSTVPWLSLFQRPPPVTT